MVRIVFILVIFFLFVNFQHLLPDIMALPINILPYFIKILPFIALGFIVFKILNRRERIMGRLIDIKDERTNKKYPDRELPRRVYQGTPEGRQYEYDQKYKLPRKRLNFDQY